MTEVEIEPHHAYVEAPLNKRMFKTPEEEIQDIQEETDWREIPGDFGMLFFSYSSTSGTTTHLIYPDRAVSLSYDNIVNEVYDIVFQTHRFDECTLEVIDVSEDEEWKPVGKGKHYHLDIKTPDGLTIRAENGMLLRRNTEATRKNALLESVRKHNGRITFLITQIESINREIAWRRKDIADIEKILLKGDAQ